MFLCFFFFFSSRRRHTRLQGDWSSDVCSSDLDGGNGARLRHDRGGRARAIYDGRVGGGAGAVLRGRGKGEGEHVSGAVKLGTRGSALALWQAEWVRAALARHRIAAELVVIATRGDAEVDRPLHQLEGKGFFTHEIEEALLDGRIDVAVNS